LIYGLSLGDLLMADRYYCTFAIIALSQAKNMWGIHVNAVISMNLKLVI